MAKSVIKTMTCSRVSFDVVSTYRYDNTKKVVADKYGKVVVIKIPITKNIPPTTSTIIATIDEKFRPSSGGNSIKFADISNSNQILNVSVSTNGDINIYRYGTNTVSTVGSDCVITYII